MEPKIKCKHLRGLQIQPEWFSTERDLAEPGEDLWQRPGTTCGCHNWRRVGSWYLVGGGQTSFHTSCSAQDSSTCKNCPAPNASSIEAEKLYFLDWLPSSLPTCIWCCPPTTSQTHHTCSFLVPASFQWAHPHPTAFVLILPSDWSACLDIYMVGPPWWLSGKESACNTGDPGSIPGSGRFPWRRKWQPTPVFLLGESHGQRSLAGYSPWGHKESDTIEWLCHVDFSLNVIS